MKTDKANNKATSFMSSSTTMIERCLGVINKCLHSRAGDVLFIKGQSCFGKSSILQCISQKYSDKSVWFLCGIGNCFDETKLQIQYPVWKQILKNFNDKYIH